MRIGFVFSILPYVYPQLGSYPVVVEDEAGCFFNFLLTQIPTDFVLDIKYLKIRICFEFRI